MVRPPQRRSLLDDLEIQERVVEAPAPNNAVSANQEKEPLTDLNFKVTPFFRVRFRTEAGARNMRQRDLLYACFEAYLERNGGSLTTLPEVALPQEQRLVKRTFGQKETDPQS